MEEVTTVNIYLVEAAKCKGPEVGHAQLFQRKAGKQSGRNRETEDRGRIGRDGMRGEARHGGEEADRQGDKDDNVLKKDSRGPIPEGCRPL